MLELYSHSIVGTLYWLPLYDNASLHLYCVPLHLWQMFLSTFLLTCTHVHTHIYTHTHSRTHTHTHTDSMTAFLTKAINSGNIEAAKNMIDILATLPPNKGKFSVVYDDSLKPVQEEQNFV